MVVNKVPFHFVYRAINDIREVPKAAKFSKVPSNKKESILLQNCFVNLCTVYKITYTHEDSLLDTDDAAIDSDAGGDAAKPQHTAVLQPWR